MSLDRSPVINDVLDFDGEDTWNHAELVLFSGLLKNIVLQDPTLNSQDATELQWGSLALANMVAILRDHGYEVIEPSELCNDGEGAEGDEDGEERQESLPAKGMKWVDNGSSTPPTIVANGTLHRFQILTSIVEQNRGEDGRVDANVVEDGLIRQDPNAFDKEGVEQLKQYLMKARESGVPIKFDGDHSGLHQVWFKGHRDLATALSRYCHVVAVEEASPIVDDHFSGNYSRQSQSDFSNDWRQRPNHHQITHPAVTGQITSGQIPLVGYGFHNELPQSSLKSLPKSRAFDIDFLLDLLHSCGSQITQGANASEVEEKLLDVVPSLYEIKPGVKRFNHYLMNMRAAGAPIWFNRNEQGDPNEIFLKNSTPPAMHRSISSPKWRNGNTSEMKSSPSENVDAAIKLRFASLIEAYRYHHQVKSDCADGHLIQARMEFNDSKIYNREQCSNFKQLLKVARMNGLDLTWEQRDNTITRIRLICQD